MAYVLTQRLIDNKSKHCHAASDATHAHCN